MIVTKHTDHVTTADGQAPCAGFVPLRWLRPRRWHWWITGSVWYDVFMDGELLAPRERRCRKCGAR